MECWRRRRLDARRSSERRACRFTLQPGRLPGPGSEGGAHRAAEERDERRRRPADAGVLVQEAVARHRLLVEHRVADEVLALEVVDERVIGVVARRCSLERVSAKLEDGCEGRPASGRQPLIRVGCDRRADLAQRRRVRVPDTDAGERTAGLEVEVVARRVGVFREQVAEVDPGLRLVRRLVLREADVAVDAEERAAGGSRVGAKVGADLVEERGEVADELQRRFLDAFFVAALVGLKPLAVVVPAELAQELEQNLRERRVLNRR